MFSSPAIFLLSLLFQKRKLSNFGNEMKFLVYLRTQLKLPFLGSQFFGLSVERGLLPFFEGFLKTQKIIDGDLPNDSSAS